MYTKIVSIVLANIVSYTTCQIRIKIPWKKCYCMTNLSNMPSTENLEWCWLTASLLEVCGDTKGWEQEGMPGGTWGNRQFVPSAYDIQCGVRGGSTGATCSSPQVSELVELKQKKPPNQSNQLTQITALSQNQQRSRPPCNGPVLSVSHPAICSGSPII